MMLLWSTPTSFAQVGSQGDANGVPMTAYFSETGTDLASLAAGEAGRGTILYYLPERGIERPSLVVRLSKQPDAEIAVAEVFDAPLGLDYVPVQIEQSAGNDEGDRLILDPTVPTVITIQALDGWWVRDGAASASQLVNYNLNIEIRGPIPAMWGTSYDPDLGPQGWAELVERGQLAVRIAVRDPEQRGIPQWDLRLLEPEFDDRGDFRSSYAERKCETSSHLDLGVSPLWPYVAYEGQYELSRGQQRPPIVVDWNQGRIIYFSEMVSVRHQSCVYAFNSVNRLTLGELNQANYETPWAFYDLSGQANGYPNLLLRSERYPAKDPWIGGLEKDLEVIRYSWRNTVGDAYWDYKIEVLGFHPYSDTTPIAGGLLAIDAPSYERFPEWVIEKEWPVVTFIDSEGNSYQSNEGLYEWSPREVGIGYALGWQEAHAEAAFSRIRPGLRGEYRFRKNLPPTLYLSPIDNRLHLLGGEGGLWHMSEHVLLRLHNLDHGLYINGWTRERISKTGIVSEEREGEAEAASEVEEALYSLNGYLLYSTRDEVLLRQATPEPSMLDILPPKDSPTWHAFKEQVEATTQAKRDPLDLKSWLNEFPGETLAINKARFYDIRATQDGFRFVLDLQPGFELQQAPPGEWGVSGDLTPGRYLVRYDGQWTVEPLSLPSFTAKGTLSIRITLPEEQENYSILDEIPIQVLVENRALHDLKNVQLIGMMTNGEETWPITRQKMDLLSGQSLSIPQNWHPKSAEQWILRFWLQDQQQNILVETSQPVTIPPSPEADGRTIFSLSTGEGQQSLAIVLLFAVGASMMSALFMTRYNNQAQ